MAGNSWSQTCQYTEPEVRRCAPTAGGVYRLMYTRDGQLHVFYVGESNNLEERLLRHLGSAEENACIRRQLQSGVCSFDFVRVAPESERRRVEGDTIRRFTPTCNP